MRYRALAQVVTRVSIIAAVKSPTKSSVAILGAGAMGSTIARGLLRVGWDVERITLAEPDGDRRRTLAGETGLVVVPTAAEAVTGADVVVVAVKPNVVPALLDEIAPAVAPSQLVVTLAAGVPLAVFERALPGVPVVRTMPNTPAAVEQAMTAYAAGSQVGDQHLVITREILSSVGEVVEVPEEALDAVTAVSGSGPAYLFLLAEAMIDAGVARGLQLEIATQLVHQTMRGAGLLLHSSGRSAAELRVQVTSPNGTTAAALDRFEQGGFRQLVAEAITAAALRSEELGREAAQA